MGTKKFSTAYLAITASFLFQICIALECYTCNNIQNVLNCADTSKCSDGQSCYLNVSSAGFTLGCLDNKQCGGLPLTSSLHERFLRDENGIPITKENHGEDRRAITRQNTENCFECCSSDICNVNLCKHLKPTSCIDDPKVDCALVNSKFSICLNIHEAKTVCPKFCGLCALVDGGWADWSEWSPCDVTCANGTQTRVRQCSNPAPVNGGLDCLGDGNETKICILSECPIDGNWAVWSAWSECDVTCQNGTQTRTRTCSDPAPEYSGQNCSGPSTDQKDCVKVVCPVQGGWTEWLAWGPCPVTCDVGIKRRHRTCTNPIPNSFDMFCLGDSMDVKICHSNPCQGVTTASTPTVAFRSSVLKNLVLSFEHTLVFTTTLLNEGNGYDNNTGIFTAPFAGLYYFSVQICLGSGNSEYTHYAIVRNNIYVVRGVLLHSDRENYKSYTFDAIVKLNLGDGVWVQNTDGQGALCQFTDAWNMFQGYLVHT